MRIIALLGVALLAGLGCRDQGPAIAGGSARFETAAANVVQVFGGGTVVIEDVEGLPRGTYTFNAVLDAAGQASGAAQLHFATSDVKVHIDVQCLALQRNEAWLSGPVTRSTDPARLGKVMVWQVQDNGRDAPADRISSFAWLGGSDNYAPDVCKWKYPMTTRPWQNGSVRIQAPSALALSDMVGTWDVTKYICVNLANPADTQFLAGSGIRMRQTVAPDGRFSMVWWNPGPPGRIIENSRGWMDVVNGTLLIGGPGGMGVIEAVARRSGNVSYIEFDGNVCHWDDDGEEDPSHVVAESWLKRTGTLVNDLAGVWTATVYRYTSQADPSVFVDQIADGVSITLTLGLDSHYIMDFRLGPQSMQDEGEMIFEGDQILSRRSNGGDESYGTFELHQGVWSFSGAAEYDFDDDPGTPPEPAILQAVLVRA